MGPPGHFGVALAAKAAAPRAPLWLLLLASEWLDLLSFAFIALGVENAGASRTDLIHGVQTLSPPSIAWSHGLFMAIAWSLATAVLTGLLFRDRRTGLVTGLVVLSHWILDFIVHLPDLPLLFAGSPLLGLGLWSSGPGLIVAALLELGLLAGGIALAIVARKKMAGSRRSA